MTDEELMLAICKGDQSAYQTVVKEHLKPISHYAYRLLGNQKDTEDITQETFLKLWINAATWQPEKSKLTTWLHRITHNLCVDYLRKHSRVQTQDNFEEHLVDSSEETNDRNVDFTQRDLCRDSEKIRILDSALNQLPESQRSAIMLCTVQNFSNKEAAVIMDISVKALESIIARGKRTLKSIIRTMADNGNTDELLEKQKVQ
ncbi:MAG: RNA polymerase sigma-70 factor (ECF subfamily) [Pseudohongiellaceae bacterium]|jgi:RNA polymerase sigma-70 factor (ECF subfamily)